MIYFATEKDKFDKEIRYAAESMFRIMNVDWKWYDLTEREILCDKDYLIAYGDDFNVIPYSELPCPMLGIQKSHQLFGESFGKIGSMPKTPLVTPEFVSLYRCEEKGIGGNTDVLRYDVLADIFFTLSRYEEYAEINPIKRDQFGRFPGEKSVAYRFDFLDRPMVDEWAFYIKKYIDKSGCEYSAAVKERRSKLFVTHDVDTLKKYSNWTDTLRGINRKEISWTDVCLRKDPNDNLLQLAKWENAHKIKSSFYFMAAEGDKNANYSVRSRKIKRLMKRIMRMKGHEVGYHASFYTTEHPDLCCRELQDLRKALGTKNFAGGSRQHFLKNRVPDTFLALEKEGILYDTTLSFADKEGFRCGTCHPFRHYDIYERREMAIWEIPLIVMDSTLKRYQKYSTTILEEKLKKYYKTIKRFEGVFTILWHNHCFMDEEWKYYRKVYCSCVVHWAQKLQSCTGLEIIEDYERLASPHKR